MVAPSAIAASKSPLMPIDRKSTRLNSSHSQISYAVFCLKKKQQDVKRFTSTQLPEVSQQRSPGSLKYGLGNPVLMAEALIVTGRCKSSQRYSMMKLPLHA